jgi:signal peptidase I
MSMKIMFLFFLRYMSRTLVAIILLILLIRGFIIDPGRINGRSMEPTFIDEDIFFVNKYILLLRSPRRGDVVQARDPLSNHLVVKRVIGLPGEQLAIHDNAVWLIFEDGSQQKIEEPWLSEDVWIMSDENNDIIYLPIQPYSYFLMGDNRENSADSRRYGSIHRKEIYGLVMNRPF